MPQEIKNSSRILLIADDVIVFVLLACDSVFGLIACLMFDFREAWSFVNAAVFIPALPIFALVKWSRRTTILLLWCLFFARWIVECFDGKPPALCNPLAWPMGLLLFVGVFIMQVSYLLKASDS